MYCVDSSTEATASTTSSSSSPSSDPEEGGDNVILSETDRCFNNRHHIGGDTADNSDIDQVSSLIHLSMSSSFEGVSMLTRHTHTLLLYHKDSVQLKLTTMPVTTHFETNLLPMWSSGWAHRFITETISSLCV